MFPPGYRFPSTRICPPGLPSPEGEGEGLALPEEGIPPGLDAITGGLPNVGALDVGVAANRDISTIICPFFTTMIVNKALENKAVYTRFELLEFSQEAGVPRRDAQAHTEGNFLNIPTGFIDLFDMEGLLTRL